MLTDIEFVGELRRVDVRLGDRYVITTPGVISRETRQHLMTAWRRFAGEDVGGFRLGAPDLLILDAGMQIGVIRKEVEPANDNRCPHTIDLFEGAAV